MTGKPDDLIVISLPETLNSHQRRTFVRALAGRMKGYRPRLVLDCSRLQGVDRSAIHLLLCCLEEALRRNGDARLAGLAPAAKTMLETTGADRLFRTFASSADAIKSFFQSAATLALQEEEQADGDQLRQRVA